MIQLDAKSVYISLPHCPLESFRIVVRFIPANNPYEIGAKYPKQKYIEYIQKIYNKLILFIFLEVLSDRFQKCFQIRKNLIFSKKASSREK